MEGHPLLGLFVQCLGGLLILLVEQIDLACTGPKSSDERQDISNRLRSPGNLPLDQALSYSWLS